METRYEKIKQYINDIDDAALWLAETAAQIIRACPYLTCIYRGPGICERCPMGWRWSMREDHRKK